MVNRLLNESLSNDRKAHSLKFNLVKQELKRIIECLTLWEHQFSFSTESCNRENN